MRSGVITNKSGGMSSIARSISGMSPARDIPYFVRNESIASSIAESRGDNSSLDGSYPDIYSSSDEGLPYLTPST